MAQYAAIRTMWAQGIRMTQLRRSTSDSSARNRKLRKLRSWNRAVAAVLQITRILLWIDS